jgi:hypothetical protein
LTLEFEQGVSPLRLVFPARRYLKAAAELSAFRFTMLQEISET